MYCRILFMVFTSELFCIVMLINEFLVDTITVINQIVTTPITRKKCWRTVCLQNH